MTTVARIACLVCAVVSSSSSWWSTVIVPRLEQLEQQCCCSETISTSTHANANANTTLPADCHHRQSNRQTLPPSLSRTTESTAIMTAPPAASFWRIAGLSYLQYVNRAAVSVRSALKEPAKSKLAVQGEFHYKASAWAAGEQGPKVDVTTFAGAGK